MRYRLPFTLRLVFYIMRAASKTFVTVLCVWLFLAPASGTELEALGARAGTDRPDGLIPMRLARVMLTIAPQRSIDTVTRAMGPHASPALVEAMLRKMAAGSMTKPANTTQERQRDIGGPKFIQVDRP